MGKRLRVTHAVMMMGYEGIRPFVSRGRSTRKRGASSIFVSPYPCFSAFQIAIFIRNGLAKIG